LLGPDWLAVALVLHTLAQALLKDLSAAAVSATAGGAEKIRITD